LVVPDGHARGLLVFDMATGDLVDRLDVPVLEFVAHGREIFATTLSKTVAGERRDLLHVVDVYTRAHRVAASFSQRVSVLHGNRSRVLLKTDDRILAFGVRTSEFLGSVELEKPWEDMTAAGDERDVFLYRQGGTRLTACEVSTGRVLWRRAMPRTKTPPAA
jgi:hypothetical protein